jgi:Zn-dependent protease
MDLSLNFSPPALNMLELAQHYAAWHQSDRTEPEHLLLALLGSNDAALSATLDAMGIDSAELAGAVAAELPPMIDDAATPPLSPLSQTILGHAVKEAQLTGHPQVGGLHLLAALLYETSGPAYAALAARNIGLYDVREHLLAARVPAAVRTARPAPGYAAPPAVALGSVRPSPVFLLPLLIMLGSGMALFQGLAPRYTTPTALLFVFSGWIVSLCLHEFGHAIVAYLGGDTSVRSAGYLTLNPLKYTHPMLSIILPLIFVAMGGIGLPGGAVYINTERLRSRAWRSAVAAAGPLATLLFGLLMIWPFWFSWYDFLTPENLPFWAALAFLGFLQITALLFNLLPVPSLDGFNIFAAWLPARIRNQIQSMGSIFFFILLAVLWQDSPIRDGFWSAIFRVVDLAGLPRDLVIDALDLFF